ncbi:hypothetical protein M378DRAFT_87502 [Amanita muscaria Koide BX008]|uniref:Uncharacterized protein n=1 Tax=Amanita muscaria (strain Koide BX008) TaxID=946122 RepID=A0A0C2SUF5_AMAMK|nr:hypothetical protein M378DRAFT_87502 [Amanita muscaria Koide BX008]
MNLSAQPFLIAAILQPFLYGLYLITFGHALRWLVFEEEGWSLRSREKVNWLLFTTTVIVFMFSTVDLILESSLQLTFTDYEAEITQQLIISSVAVETSSLLITDAVMIIRCWLVYQRSWRAVCFPCILWLANITCVILWVTAYAMLMFRPAPIYEVLLNFPLQVFYCCNFATNLYATGAIVYRLWRIAKVTNNRSSILYRLCRIVAGTGLLYTSTSLPMAVLTFFMVTDTPAYTLCDTIVGHANFSAAGITFNLLLIRMGQLRAEVMDLDESTRDISGSVVLSTVPVQFNIPDIATNDGLHDSVSARQRNHTDANPKER